MTFSFTDKENIAVYAKDAVSIVTKNSIMNGFGGLFNPNEKATRAEAAVTIYNIYNSIYKY